MASRRGRRGRGFMRETTSPLPMRSTTLSSTLTPPSLPSQRFLTPAKPTKAATKSTSMTPKATNAKPAAKPRAKTPAKTPAKTQAKTPAAPTKKENHSLPKLKELREEAKNEYGYESDEYKRLDNKVQYREKCERTKPIEKRDWSLVKEKYRTEVSLDKPKRVVISEAHIYGGVQINYVGGVPTREEALALGHDKFTKIEEGGILKLDPKCANQMSVDKKNKGIHMIGRAFGILTGEDFAYEDAKITRDLLFGGNGDRYNVAETIAMYIYYVYYNEKKRYHVEEEVGIMIFTPHTVKKPNGNCHSTKSIKVANLVQFCIMDSRRSRGLGNIALENGFKILKDQYKFDFVTLFGCYRRFYDETCGMECNPKWFDCPFNLKATKEENEAHFFYDILDQPWKSGPMTRFERNIVEVFNKHNLNIENDEDKEKFTLGFKATCLYDYYLIDQIEGPVDTAEMLSALHPHDENDAPRESLKEK